MLGRLIWPAPPSASVLAVRELEATRRELLVWQSGLEQAKHAVACLQERIRRLEALTQKTGGM